MPVNNLQSSITLSLELAMEYKTHLKRYKKIHKKKISLRKKKKTQILRNYKIAWSQKGLQP
jgi:hypothetical protein